jgi:cytochrome P450
LENVINEKKENIKNDPKLMEKGDLMTVLLSDPIFGNNLEMIVDECITFFMAGTQTTSSLVGHTIA